MDPSTEVLSSIRNAEPVFWENPGRKAEPDFSFSLADMEDAEARLRRFAPWIARRFPETAAAGGITAALLFGLLASLAFRSKMK